MGSAAQRTPGPRRACAAGPRGSSYGARPFTALLTPSYRYPLQARSRGAVRIPKRRAHTAMGSRRDGVGWGVGVTSNPAVGGVLV